MKSQHPKQPREERHPNTPPTAREVSPSISLRDAAWWPCAQPCDELAFMLSVSAHFLGYDQTRSFWVQCLVSASSDFSGLAFVAWNKTARGFITEPQDALCLYAYARLYDLAALAANRHPVLGSLTSAPRHYHFEDEESVIVDTIHLSPEPAPKD